MPSRSEHDSPDRQKTPKGEEREAANLPGEGGNVIPVPKKDDVMAALRNVAKANEEDPTD